MSHEGLRGLVFLDTLLLPAWDFRLQQLFISCSFLYKQDGLGYIFAFKIYIYFLP